MKRFTLITLCPLLFDLHPDLQRRFGHAVSSNIFSLDWGSIFLDQSYSNVMTLE